MSLPVDSQRDDSPREVRLGEFELDLRTAELRNNGYRFILQGQPFQVMTILLERPGELVTREELKKRLWSSDTFVDFDHSLNKAVNRLREALHDPAEKPRYVETIPRRGYRLIAPVRWMESPPAQAQLPVREAGIVVQGPSVPEDPTEQKFATRRLRWQYAAKLVTALILLVTGLVLLRWRDSSGAKGIAGEVHSLAVLPLENLSGDPSQDYFADGMTDELITNLGQISSLRVISRTSVMRYKGVRKSLSQIARELNVEAVVEGTVVRSGDQVRIAARLIHTAADKHLWAQNYQGNVRDVLGLQNQIASAIAKQIRMTLIPRDQIRAGIERPSNPVSYESYLRGEYFLNRFTPDSISKAADYFQQAIEEDPNYVPAYVKLAGSYQMLANMNVIPKKTAYAKAKSLVARALELDPQFAAAHAVEGWRLLLYELDFAAAAPEFKRAVELNPNGTEGHEGLATYYDTIGKLRDSVLEMERARELDPLALIVNTDLCRALFYARQYDEALSQCRANIDLDPNAPRAFWLVGDVYAAKGVDSEAVTSFLQALQLASAPPSMIAAAKNGARDTGLKGFWKALVQFVPENVANGNLDAYEAAVDYTYAGDTDKALFWLGKAVETRCYGITYLGVNPLFDQLRSNPRFLSLLRRVGLPQSESGSP